MTSRSPTARSLVSRSESYLLRPVDGVGPQTQDLRRLVTTLVDVAACSVIPFLAADVRVMTAANGQQWYWPVLPVLLIPPATAGIASRIARRYGSCRADTCARWSFLTAGLYPLIPSYDWVQADVPLPNVLVNYLLVMAVAAAARKTLVSLNEARRPLPGRPSELAEALTRAVSRSGSEVDLSTSLVADTPLPSDVAHAFLEAAGEALRNSIIHADRGPLVSAWAQAVSADINARQHAQEISRNIMRTHIDAVRNRVTPVLTTIADGAPLTQNLCPRAQLLEAELRDELRAPPSPAHPSPPQYEPPVSEVSTSPSCTDGHHRPPHCH
ncbi:hypothetical protein [Actinomyces trachealis]|uniref:hypothetical protein n=1 Tax=Actinomyces trachealis TaxID=2763540 RepID=UPI0018C6A93C|nr:hypothetical protein [Actinomyces trachealis]